MEPYLESSDEGVRFASVEVLSALTSEDAAKALQKGLEDESPVVRDRAARGLYARVQTGAPTPSLSTSLEQSLKLGAPGAAALMLLGVDGGPRAKELAGASRTAEHEVKLAAGGPIVQARWPALVALSRLGDQDARQAIAEATRSNDLAVLQFLLQVVDAIDSAALLNDLAAAALTDQRVLTTEEAKPGRRLCDLAVDVLVRRLTLKPGFPLTPSERYSEEHRAAILAIIRGSVPH